jgi:hypothetical protein
VGKTLVLERLEDPTGAESELRRRHAVRSR